MNTGTRRKFLVTSLAALLAGTAGAVLYPLLRYLAPRRTDTAQQAVRIPLAEIPDGTAKFFDFEGKPAVLVSSKGKLACLSAVCTHLGCIVQWQKDQEEFRCPCHGGRFTIDGTVVSGPPPRPLAKLPFTVANDTVTVG